MWNVPLPDNTDALKQLYTALNYKDGTPKYSLTEAEEHQIKTFISGILTMEVDKMNY